MQFLSFQLGDYATGAAIPNGKCFVYLTGTSTLAALFNSSGGTIANPAIASGVAQVGFAAADGVYDLQPAYPDGTPAGPKILSQQMIDTIPLIVRKGAKGDWDINTGTGTNDSAAFTASLGDLQAQGVYFTGLGYSSGAKQLDVPMPKRSYRLGSTIDLNITCRIQGPGTGQAGGMPGIFSVAPGIAAFRYQAGNTVGDSGTYSPGSPPLGANGSVISGVTVVGPGFNGTTLLDVPTARGHLMRVGVSLRDFNVWHMQGPAVEMFAGVASPELGNANCWELTSGWIQDCLYGIKTSGSDTNAGIATHVKMSSIRCWGIEDISGAANLYLAPLTQLCGVGGTGTVNDPTAIVHQSGVHYAARAGQEVGASTNAPPAGHNDNTWWLWYEDGAAGSGGTAPVTWFSGMHLRAGGPYRIVNGGTIVGAYWEGNQPPSQCGGGALFIGGTWGGVRPFPIGAAWINAGAGQVTMNDLKVVSGGVQTADDVSAGLVIGRYTPGNPAFVSAGGLATQLTLVAAGGTIVIGAAEVDILSTIYVTSTTMNPFADNAVSLGGSAHRYKELWAASATIQTSDRHHKEQIRHLSDKPFDALLDAVGAVPLVAFKFKDAVAAKGHKARDHYGIVAQDLRDELVKRGLDPFAGGVLGCDPVMEEIEEEVELEREVMSIELQPKEITELIDGKWIKRIELIEKPMPYYDYHQLHDEDGNPLIKPAQPEQKIHVPIFDENGDPRIVLDPDAKRFRPDPGSPDVLIPDPDGPIAEMVRPAVPEQPIMHPVRRMERVTEKQKVMRPKLNANDEQEMIWSVRYDEFWALRQAWLERRPAATHSELRT